VNVDPDYVEIHTGKRVAPNFFAWVIPLGGERARVGLACKGRNLKKQLNNFIAERFGGGSRAELVATRSGSIVTCGPIEKTYDDSLLVVGDAAGQVKPTTGGGVILGGICASIAGEVAARAVREDGLTSAFLRRYEVLWRRRLGREFTVAGLARRVISRLSDRQIDKLFRIVIKERLQGELSIEGDIDFQGRMILKLLKRRDILTVLPFLWRALP
jgi:flavin-dependent dehydrogenase